MVGVTGVEAGVVTGVVAGVDAVVETGVAIGVVIGGVGSGTIVAVTGSPADPVGPEDGVRAVAPDRSGEPLLQPAPTTVSSASSPTVARRMVTSTRQHD